MLIHSVTPNWYLLDTTASVPIDTTPFAKGYLEGYRQDGVFHITRVISTDPSVYLNPDFAPGSSYPLSRSGNNLPL